MIPSPSSLRTPGRRTLSLNWRASNSQVQQFGLACFLLCCTTLVWKSSVTSQRQTSIQLARPKTAAVELELETLVHDHDDHSDPSEPEPQYPLPPPIAYFQHGEHGLGSFSQLDGSHEYCVLNTTREDCCSPEHCATIVRRSTLYSECCHHVHTTAHPTTGEPVVAKHSKIYDLLITGVPRTGMWYMQQLLTKTGLSGLTTAEHSAYWTGTVSWKHIFERPQYYFGPRTATHLYHSKFKMIWHMVRDPLATLTSIAFTEPLWEDSEISRTYIDFIASHVPLTNKTTLMTKLNISSHEMDDTTRHNMANMGNHHNPKLDDFLIFRSLEIFLHWNGFINLLQVPMFRVEDLSLQQNVTVLDEIFRSVGKDAPSHDKVRDILQAQDQQRHQQHQRQLQQQRQSELERQQQQQQQQHRGLLTQQRPRKRIRKGARIHRHALSWTEICRASPDLATSFLEMSQSFGYYADKEVATLCE